MQHQFKFEIEGHELPLQSFSVMVGERICETVITVPPLPAFFYLPPGSYMRLIYKDPVLGEIVLSDGILIGVGFSKTAASQTIDLRFVDPIQYVFDYPLVYMEYNSSVPELQFYSELTKFLLQDVVQKTKKDGTYQAPLLSESLNSLLQLIRDKPITFGDYINHAMESVFNASVYTKSVDRKFRISKRYVVFGSNIEIPTRYQVKQLLEYFLTYGPASQVSSVMNYFDYLLNAVSLVWYYQSVFLADGSNIILVPKYFMSIPPRPNVFYPSMITMLNIGVDHSMPTRVMEIIELNNMTFYVAYPESNKLTDLETLKGVKPHLHRVAMTEALGLMSESNPSIKTVKEVGEYFAKRQLYEIYLRTNTGQIKTPFYPHVLLGFPALILTPTGHYCGIVTGARHEYNAEGDAASFISLGAVTPVEVLTSAPTKYLNRDVWSVYRYLLGNEAPRGENIMDVSNLEFEEYMSAVYRNSSKLANQNEPEESLFWWAYERNVTDFKVAGVERISSSDPIKSEILSSISNTLKNAIIPDSTAEELHKKVADFVKSKGLHELLYPTKLWLVGRNDTWNFNR